MIKDSKIKFALIFYVENIPSTVLQSLNICIRTIIILVYLLQSTDMW